MRFILCEQNKCKTNEFLPLNQRDVFKNALHNKIQQCKQFTTYEVVYSEILYYYKSLMKYYLIS